MALAEVADAGGEGGALMAVLTLNAGSSSLKFALFEAERAILRGEIESIDEGPTASARDARGEALAPPDIPGAGHEAVLPALFDWVQQHLSGARLEGVGHRIVHGGEREGPALVEDGLMAELERLCPLAPLHQPHNLAAIAAVARARPGLPQVACFDTAFHRTLPDAARRHALPERLGMRRYGFHGLSFQHVAESLPPGLKAGRVVVAHLGSGASLCALQEGSSVETTMGTTPLDGLVMGTRCGSLDPGVVLALVRRMGLDATEHALYHESGLLGVSGISADMRVLHAHPGPGSDAAIGLFVHRLVLDIAAMAAAMSGLDGLVFTGGIGAHDEAIRHAAVTRLGWLGVGAAVPVLVIPADEEVVIARQAIEMLLPGRAQTPGL